MSRKYVKSLCLSALILLPASAAYACHLQRLSLELSCTQYKLTMAGYVVAHPHLVKYSFAITPTSGGPPVTVTKTVLIETQRAFEEVVTEPLKLVGTFDAKSLVGMATLMAAPDKREEGTMDIQLPPTMATLDCAPRAGS